MLDILIIIYFNNILIFSKIKKKYIKYVKKMLTVLIKKIYKLIRKNANNIKKKSSFLGLELENTKFKYY